MNTILRIAIPSPLRQTFDYLPNSNFNLEKLQPGTRIKVPWRNKSAVGIFLEIANTTIVPRNKLKQAEIILDDNPVLSATILQLAKWAADYYQHPIGEVIFSCLPMALRNTRKLPLLENFSQQNWQIQTAAPSLNTYQQSAINCINKTDNFQTFLLEGVTGSGKTEVYSQIIAKKLEAKQQALVLVPEIGLTPQTVARFASRFTAPICVWHSGLTDREKLHAWLTAKTGEAAIIIGTRSAIFMPLLNPGVIILDEEHDLSFKQQSGFRYSARDLAIIRAQLENLPVILGSATPSLETLQNSTKKRYQHLSLPERAGYAVQPNFQIINVRNQYLDEGLSPQLLTVMQKHLLQKNQVLLFLNRRGFAPTLLCHSCGWIAKCQRCDARLTLHYQAKKLFCHHCDAQHLIPKECAQCHHQQLIPLGIGTQRLEKVLEKHFPDVAIVRIDRDSTRRKGSMQKMLNEIHSGEKQILIGTQMLTKGHHFPDVTLVGIIDADYYLFSADFRASERLGQLLIQVSGRAGRAEKPGEVFIQTHHPEHPLLQILINQGYTPFAQNLLQERDVTKLPPFSYLALLRAEATSDTAPENFLATAKKILQSTHQPIQIIGPMPAPMERKAGKHRAQLWLQAQKRSVLQNILKALLPQLEKLTLGNKVRWSLDVDPLEIF